MALELCVISNCRVNSEKGTDFEKEWFLNVTFFLSLLSKLHKFINSRQCSNITLRINEKITFSTSQVPLYIHKCIQCFFFLENAFISCIMVYICVWCLWWRWFINSPSLMQSPLFIFAFQNKNSEIHRFFTYHLGNLKRTEDSRIMIYKEAHLAKMK